MLGAKQNRHMHHYQHHTNTVHFSDNNPQVGNDVFANTAMSCYEPGGRDCHHEPHELLVIVMKSQQTVQCCSAFCEVLLPSALRSRRYSLTSNLPKRIKAGLIRPQLLLHFSSLWVQLLPHGYASENYAAAACSTFCCRPSKCLLRSKF